jgi:hypothetical protein
MSAIITARFEKGISFVPPLNAIAASPLHDLLAFKGGVAIKKKDYSLVRTEYPFRLNNRPHKSELPIRALGC